MNLGRIYTKGLTPNKAWFLYVDTEPELFISNFRPITDIKKMCNIYAEELPFVFETLLTDKQIKILGKLFEEYLTEYINRKGGFDKLKLYSEQDLELMFEQDREYILNKLKY